MFPLAVNSELYSCTYLDVPVYLVPKKLPSLFPGYLTLLADFIWGRTFHRLHRDTHLGIIVDTYLMQHYM